MLIYCLILFDWMINIVLSGLYFLYITGVTAINLKNEGKI